MACQIQIYVSSPACEGVAAFASLAASSSPGLGVQAAADVVASVPDETQSGPSAACSSDPAVACSSASASSAVVAVASSAVDAYSFPVVAVVASAAVDLSFLLPSLTHFTASIIIWSFTAR